MEEEVAVSAEMMVALKLKKKKEEEGRREEEEEESNTLCFIKGRVWEKKVSQIVQG